MSYTYLLAGENLRLAEAELQGFLKSQGIDENPDRNERLAITEAEPGQLKRLALVHEIGEKIFKGKIDDFRSEKLPEGSFRVRSETLSDRKLDEIEAELGETIESPERPVDLENPANTFRVYVFDDEILVSRIIEDIDRSLFEKRSNEKRPFSSPVSLDPVLARVMVNLSEVPAGEHVIDPLCGTGGCLIEAGLCGIGVSGADISDEMVEGTRENLEEYGIIVHDIIRSDIRDAAAEFDKNFSAVITDLPYGQASEVKGNPVNYFSENWDDFASKAVFCYDKPELGDMKADFEIYVHKNLTRYLFVQERS